MDFFVLLDHILHCRNHTQEKHCNNVPKIPGKQIFDALNMYELSRGTNGVPTMILIHVKHSRPLPSKIMLSDFLQHAAEFLFTC